MAEPLNIHQQQLRDRILTHAFSKFTQKGIKNVKMDDIAAELQMSKRTLYSMFADKESLLLECLKYHNELRSKDVEAIADSAQNPLDAYVKVYELKIKEIHDINPLFFSEAKRYASVIEYVHQETVRRDANMMRFIQACLDEGLLRDDLDYRLLVRVFNLLGKSVMENELYKDFPMESILSTMSQAFLMGLCTDKGKRILNKQ